MAVTHSEEAVLAVRDMTFLILAFTVPVAAEPQQALTQAVQAVAVVAVLAAGQ